jgi:hypothetical protein
MLDSYQKPTGTRYTTAVMFLMLAFVFSPALVIASRPVSYAGILFAAVCSGLCVVLAWFNWTRHSELSIPSILRRGSGRK